MKDYKEQSKCNLQSEAVQAVHRKEIERDQLFADDEVVVQVREYLRRKEEEKLWLSMIWGLRADDQFQHKKSAA
jgi:hypothetical protein